MQILDYEGKEDVHVCLSCDTEFAVRVLNDDEDEISVCFCPACGAPLEDEEEDEDMDVDDEDKYF